MIIDNQIRNDHINAIAYGQQSQDNVTPLLSVILDATITSLIETLRLLVTVTDSKNKRISPDLHMKAATQAALNGISLNSFVEKAIEKVVQ